MIGIFVYLTLCSISNSARIRIRRLRQPRYLLIAVGFVLWMSSIVVGQRRSGPLAAITVHGTRAYAIAAIVATLLLGLAWVFPAGAGLRFTSAEVQFLFTAPITRRQLLAYKVCRLLMGAVATGAFLAVLAGPPHLLPGLFFAVKAALVLAVLTLHGAGVSMYRTSAKDESQLSARRWQVLAAACVLTPAARTGLVFVAFSPSGSMVWTMPLAVLLIAANVLWIVRSDSAFEEAAADAADKANRATTSGHFSAPRISSKRSSQFQLAPRGPVETAILWKNWLLLGRISRRGLVVSAIILGSVIAGLVVASDGLFDTDVVGNVSMLFVALAVLMGPAMLRIDLRQDLGHLALIKTWPVRGSAVIRGELLAPAAALSLLAGLAIVVGSAFSPDLPFTDRTGAVARVLFAASAVLTVTAVIVAQLVVHNGIAVTFPTWVELKAAPGAAGMEMNARMMIVMYGALLVLAVAFIVPGAAAAAVYYLAGGLLVPSGIFAVLLTAESLCATEIFGRILDRTDLQDVIVTE